MTKGSPPDAGNYEFECILLQSGLCVLGFFCSLSTSSSDGICPAVTWQNGFYSWCLQGWPQAAAHLKGFKRKSTSNCHKQLPSMIFFLWLASPLFNSPHLKVAVTSTPTLIFRNSSILPCFIPSFPCSSFMPPQTFMMLLLLSFSLFCLSSPFCRKPWRLSDAAGIRQVWRICRGASLYLCPSPGIICRWRWQMTWSPHKAISDRQCGKKMDLWLSGLLCPVCCPSDLFHLCRI